MVTEHSDGSLIFRFADPSEVAKDDELKESNARVEVIVREGKEKSSSTKKKGKEKSRTVRALEGKHEREVIVKKIEREEEGQVRDKAANVANSVVAIGSGSNVNRVADEVSESCDKLFEDAKQVQLPVSASSTEVEEIEKQDGGQESNEAADFADVVVDVGSSRVTDGVSESSENLLDDPIHIQLRSTSSAEVEKVEKEYGSQESEEADDVVVAIGCESGRVTEQVNESSEKLLEDPKDFELSVSTSSAEVQKIKREEGSEGSNEAVDVSNSLMTIDSESSRVTDGTSESSEKLFKDPKEVQLHGSVSVVESSSPVVDIENSGHDEQTSSIFVPKKSSELDNGHTHSEVLDRKSDNEEVLQSVSLKPDFDTVEGDNNRDPTLENFEILDSSMHAEDQSVESVRQNVPEDSSEDQSNELMPLSPLNEVEAILDKKAENDTVQESVGEDITEEVPTVRFVSSHCILASLVYYFVLQ